MLTRRIALGGVMAGVGASTLPSTGQAMIGRIPWKALLEGVSAIVTGLDLYVRFFGSQPASGGGPPRICAVSESELRTIHRLCVELAVATNTKDYEIAIEPGDGGLLPALASYTEKPSPSTWRRVRNEAGRFASTAFELLQALSRPGGIADAVEAGEKTRVLAQLRHGLEVVNGTLDLKTIWLGRKRLSTS